MHTAKTKTATFYFPDVLKLFSDNIMGSAWETNATDEVRRISSFLSVCARADKGHRSMVHKLPATILAFAGFVSTSELKVTCSYCHYEPDLEKIQNIVKKAPISILFVLILEHLRNAQTCIISKLCFVAYFSKEQIRETLNNIIISSKQNLKQDSYLELDCEQGFQKDSAKQMNFLEVKLSISADSLSFESLAKRCKDTTNMKSAEARLLTFKNWCFTHVVTPLALACDGFYRHESKSASDSVKCVYCGLTLFQWEPNDVVSMEHRDKSPNCPFKTGKVANDILNETEVYYHRCLTMFRSKLFDEKVLKSDQDFNATVKKILNLFSFKGHKLVI